LERRRAELKVNDTAFKYIYYSSSFSFVDGGQNGAMMRLPVTDGGNPTTCFLTKSDRREKLNVDVIHERKKENEGLDVL
jgi:hypothetical protein